MPEYWKSKLCILLLSTIITSTIINADDGFPGIHIINSYAAEIEATYVTSKYTMVIKEFFQSAINDLPQKGSLVQTSEGVDVKIVLDYSTDKIFIVADGKCHFKNISVYMEDLFTGNLDPLLKHPVITSKEAIRFVEDSKWTKVNKTMIRGIETTHWSAQLNKGIAKLTVDAFFTDGWDTEAGAKAPVPVRFDVYGTIDSKKFHAIFDYFFFEYYTHFSFKEEVDAFEMPATIYCKGSNTSVKMPDIPETYSYTAEIVNHRQNTIEISKVWYDSENELLRQDSHPPDYALKGYPVTELYDLRTGVVYTIDTILQNCSVKSLKQNGIDNAVILDPMHKGKFIELILTDPMAYLRIEDNKFTYIEQRERRDIICDVYASEHSMVLADGKSASVLFVFYFMSEDWQLYPDIGGPKESLTRIPIMLEVFVEDEMKDGDDPEYTLDTTYNFIDFTYDVPTDVFGIPQCYSRNTEIYFKIAFPADLIRSRTKELEKKLHALIADSTGVVIHRVQRLSIHADPSFVFVKAAITDRTKPEALFSRIRNKALKGTDTVKTYQNSNLQSCASECLKSDACSGFDLTNDAICHLTEVILADVSNQLADSTTATFYTRTIFASSMIKETSVADAWKSLTGAIYSGNFVTSLMDPSTNKRILYTAMNVELLFGAIGVAGNPKFPPQMSYRAEYAEPALEITGFHATWYDSQRKLARFDQRFLQPKAPFYSVNPLTTINDFTEGVSYHIDQALGNCTILPLADDPTDAAEQKKDNTIILTMKNPAEVFKMDSKFKFYGQKTVRGILCDVYEAIRHDYRIPGLDHTTTTTFRYYFVNSQWSDRSDSGRLRYVPNTPVQLEIMSGNDNYYFVYNFFDYSDDIPTMDVFDIRNCFERRNEFEFQITFSASSEDSALYDPTEFIQQAEKEIAAAAKVNILRIQEAVLEYDSKFVYLTANLLTYPPAKAHFRKFAGKVLQHKEDKTIPNVKSVDECADKCMKESTFACNSFDFCPDGKDAFKCKLSKLFSTDGEKLNNAKVCDHYSRVVTGGKPPVDPLIAIGILKDAVASGTLNVTVSAKLSPEDPDLVRVYKAINIRDDVITTDNVRLTSENNIKKFNRVKNDTTIIASEQMRHYPKMSVDDCANFCLIEPVYKCESFAFCFSQGDCYVASSHPDQKPQMLEAHKGCSVYNRDYLYRYDKEPGVSTVTIGDKPADVTSASDCAKQCTINGDFLCQSFQYCPQMNECTLSKTHKMDIPDTEIQGNVMCDIYFRKYIDDFTMTEGKRVALVNNQILTDISEEQCAKACMEEESFNCASFDYCGNTTECRLTNRYTLNSGQRTTESSAFCNHFRRKPETFAPKASAQKAIVISSTNLTAVALGTLVGSFLFGIICMTLFLRRKPTVSI